MEIYNYFQRFDGYDVAIDTDPTNDVSEIKDVFISMQELGEHVQLNYEIKKNRGIPYVVTTSNQSDEEFYTPIEIFIDNNDKELLLEIAKRKLSVIH